MRRAALQPLTLAAKEGLALTNGTAVMCALGVLETCHAERLSQTADIAGCLSLEALHGTALAFDDAHSCLAAFPAPARVRRVTCALLLAGSDFTRGTMTRSMCRTPTRCAACRKCTAQRAMPLPMRAGPLSIELNAVTDNPLLFIDAQTEDITVLSGGNFHGEPLAIAMDYLGLAVSELGNISERRLMRLTDEASNTHVLPAFLTPQSRLGCIPAL